MFKVLFETIDSVNDCLRHQSYERFEWSIILYYYWCILLVMSFYYPFSSPLYVYLITMIVYVC